jgi:hypothetical protein
VYLNEAAAKLNLSKVQVRRLIDTGKLTETADGNVADASVDAYMAANGIGQGRRKHFQSDRHDYQDEAWSEKSFDILSHQTESGLAALAACWIDRGYLPAGGVAIGKDGRFHQAVFKRSQQQSGGEVRLKEPKQ